MFCLLEVDAFSKGLFNFSRCSYESCGIFKFVASRQSRDNFQSVAYPELCVFKGALHSVFMHSRCLFHCFSGFEVPIHDVTRQGAFFKVFHTKICAYSRGLEECIHVFKVPIHGVTCQWGHFPNGVYPALCIQCIQVIF